VNNIINFFTNKQEYFQTNEAAYGTKTLNNCRLHFKLPNSNF